MRSRFLQAVDGTVDWTGYPVSFLAAMAARNGAIPEVVEMVRDHLEQALRSHRGPDHAVAARDARWVDPITGKVLERRRPAAVLWPSSGPGDVWEVDHGVELQHGGRDSVQKYVIAPKPLHKVKSDALAQFTRWVLEQDATRGGKLRRRRPRR